MAFDGITIANIAQELNQTIVGGKINKIAQPENDELMITIKNNRTVYRLLLSASASLPLIYLTDNNKPGPMTCSANTSAAPAFSPLPSRDSSVFLFLSSSI